MDDKFIVGCLTKGEREADPRDFKTETVLGVPSDDELAKVPKAFDLSDYIGKSLYQNGRGSCSAMGTTHSLLIMNIIELITKRSDLKNEILKKIGNGENPIDLDWKDLRTKMGHNLADKNDTGDYAENAIKKAISKGIQGLNYEKNQEVYFGSAYSFQKSEVTDKDIQIMKYYIWKYKSPLIVAIRGNSKTRLEMSAGRLSTVLEYSDTTGGHLQIRCGWNEENDFIALNSWKPNNTAKTKSKYLVASSVYKYMVATKMFNWRYRVLFDKENAITDLNWLKEENTFIEILKLANTSWAKTRFPDVQKQLGELGKVIRKNYPNADKQVPLTS